MTKENKLIPVASYARYSSTNQSETSIEYQHDCIQKYCDANGYKIIKQYVDEARSGTNDDRKQFKQMLADAKRSPEWSIVLIYDYTRFSRNMSLSISALATLNDAGITLISISQPYWEDTPEQNFNRNIQFAQGDYFSQRLSKVVRDSMIVKAAKNQHCGGIPPLGYDVSDEKELVINEEEAEVVRRIFRMYDSGYSYTQMAKALNKDGITTKTGKEFTKHSFHDLLKQEKYIGTYVWNRARSKKGGKRNTHESKPIEDQIRIEGGCPAIVDRKLFDRVQSALKNKQHGKSPSKHRYHYMLVGLDILKCSCCGAYMTGASRRNRSGNYTVYACPNKGKGCNAKEIRTEYVDQFVSAHLAKDFYNRKDIHRVMLNVKRGDDYNKLVAKRTHNDNAIRNVLKAIEKEPSEELISRLKKLEQDKISLGRAIANCQLIAKDTDQETIKALAHKLKKYLKESDDLEVKEYLKSAVKSVTVSNDDIEVVLNVS